MRIRRIISAALAVALLCLAGPPAVAQEPAKVPRIGILAPRTRADGARYNEAFIRGLREKGWEPGKNVIIEYRFGEGRPERLPALAAELVRAHVDVIFSGTTAATSAAKSVTNTVPIVVATGSDVVELGFVQSLARPGGNITGLAWDVGLESFGKALELLKECLPRARRMAALTNSGNAAHVAGMKHVQSRAESIGVQLLHVPVRRAEDFEQAFAGMAAERVEGVLVLADSYFGFHRARIHELAARRRLPAMYGLREHAETGGLMSYGVDAPDNFRRAAAYVDKILRGAKPGDLPMEQPNKFELVINLKTAKALGLTIPKPFLLRADQLIE